jgi:ABC-type dipeptide/oligopeptide/nickel transport system permease component
MAHTKNMVLYLVKRIMIMVPMLLFVLIVTFTLTTFLSQNVLTQMEGLIPFDKIQEERIRVGFYDPWYIKVVKYFRNFFSGDWGTSYVLTNEVPVRRLLAQIFPKTLEIVILPIIIIPILGVKLGVISAKNRNQMKDTVIRGGIMLAVCIPSFWLALMIQYFFGTILSNLTYGAINIEVMAPNSVTMIYEPITGFRLIDAIILNNQYLLHDTLLHIYLPSLCLIIITFAGITRQTRAIMLEVLEKDYIRTARAKGVPEKDVINKHALRNSLIPTSTAIIGTTAGLLTGSLFIEMAFNYTGMGYYMIGAIQSGDYVVINGILVFTSIIIMIATLTADILYTIIDPRIVYS